MRAQILAGSVSRLLSRSPLFPGQDLVTLVIANPKAGGFTRPHIWKSHAARLELLEAESASLSEREGDLSLALRETERARHAKEIAAEFLAGIEPGKTGKAYLIVTAGGDGTSWEVQTSLMECEPLVRARVVILRLPMGTGNDGSDGRDLGQALGRLIRPVELLKRSAIRLTAPGLDRPHYAFNIASVGLDAYVTHMTNKLKGILPGDSYRLWVDIASVFYDKVYKVGPMSVRIATPAGPAKREEPYLLIAMGASGGRSYGSGNLILPDGDNLVAIRQTSLLRKLALKPLIISGRHRGQAEVEFLSATRVEIDYGQRVLCQFDGETLLLKPGDYPFIMELSDPTINTLAYRT